MSISLALETLEAGTRKYFPCPPARLAAPLRTVLLRIAVIGLVVTGACHVIPGDADSEPPVTGAPAKDATRHVGEFSGTYHEGLPVYLFPTVVVVGHRSAQ